MSNNFLNPLIFSPDNAAESPKISSTLLLKVLLALCTHRAVISDKRDLSSPGLSAKLALRPKKVRNMLVVPEMLFGRSSRGVSGDAAFPSTALEPTDEPFLLPKLRSERILTNPKRFVAGATPHKNTQAICRRHKTKLRFSPNPGNTSTECRATIIQANAGLVWSRCAVRVAREIVRQRV